MFLKVLRVLLLVAGLALLGIGTFLVIDAPSTGGHITASWTCEPDESNGSMECQTTQAGYGGPGSGDVSDFSTMPLIGIGLIGAALVLGQFQRPNIIVTAPPAQAGVGPGPPPMQQQPRWTGQTH